MFMRTLATFAVFGLATSAAAQTELRFALDGPHSASTAAIAVAADNGHFADANLSVLVEPTSGDRDAVSRVAVGTYQAGLADLNAVIAYMNDNPGADLKAVMIIHDSPAYAIIARRSSRIATPEDLEGRTLAMVPGEASAARVENFFDYNLLDDNTITSMQAEPGALAQMLASGEVDAIAAATHSALPDLSRLDLGEDETVTMRMSDHGLRHYGQAVIINTGPAHPGSGTVTRLLEAIVKGWQDSIAQPGDAVQAVLTRNPDLDPDIELDRLEMIIQDNVLTDWVRENGMGDMHYGRIEGAIAQIQADPNYVTPIEHYVFFDNSMLPRRAERSLD